MDHARGRRCPVGFVLRCKGADCQKRYLASSSCEQPDSGQQESGTFSAFSMLTAFPANPRSCANRAELRSSIVQICPNQLVSRLLRDDIFTITTARKFATYPTRMTRFLRCDYSAENKYRHCCKISLTY